jgi:hypothetical protein
MWESTIGAITNIYKNTKKKPRAALVVLNAINCHSIITVFMCMKRNSYLINYIQEQISTPVTMLLKKISRQISSVLLQHLS